MSAITVNADSVVQARVTLALVNVLQTRVPLPARQALAAELCKQVCAGGPVFARIGQALVRLQEYQVWRIGEVM